MSTESILGTGSPTTNEKSPRVKGGAPEPSSQAAAGELTPDRPPQSPVLSPEGGADPKTKRRRGFAAMDRKLVSEIARKGGKAAHSAGTAHEFTTDEARVAGRKGGRATHDKRRRVVEEPHDKTESDKTRE